MPKTLAISPRSGSTRTTVTLTGSGFIRNGTVRFVFHASRMGETGTDGEGRFTARLSLPRPDFYAHFAGQTFSISTTEYTRAGEYQGNGPSVGFHVN
ncbi:hypothetical protein [Kitasatospora sp. DSM 101779]|uniref:hypothetical protein n=1 Tax=Kitasatospora sp. DSM 101779 TaxID=2853165 RepID=UPI0021D9C483|nr:hypothetical protein [Kitasatospora sp. DSM 101779]MCU7827121.1 hypothetical protein [Kitasatospora sp. DSM 101779]